MIFALISACAVSLLAGFIWGNRSQIRIVTKTERRAQAEIQKQREEFKNFLEYDGSEQL